jgi:hypothetical protein
MFIMLHLNTGSVHKSRETGDGPHIQRTKIFPTVAFGGITLKANIQVDGRPVNFALFHLNKLFGALSVASHEDLYAKGCWVKIRISGVVKTNTHVDLVV